MVVDQCVLTGRVSVVAESVVPMVAGATADLDLEATLAAVDRCYDARVEAESASLELAAHFADRHGGDGLERGRLPLIWARVRAREARVGNVRLVAARTRHLSVETAAAVDAAMVAFVDGSVPWGRFESRLDGRVVAADPQVAAAREAARAREQFAKRTRSSEDGTAGFCVRSSVGVIARVEATVAFVAEALAAFEDPAARVDLDLRRVRAVLVLCNPTGLWSCSLRTPRSAPAHSAPAPTSTPAEKPGPSRTSTRRPRLSRPPTTRAPLGPRPGPGGSVGADGRLRTPGRVHPQAPARLADPAHPRLPLHL
jgi:hypothetical protein